MNSNDRIWIEYQIWGHPSKNLLNQGEGGGRRNPDIYSYLLRNSTHTQRRGRSDNANFDRASLMDSPNRAAAIIHIHYPLPKWDTNGGRELGNSRYWIPLKGGIHKERPAKIEIFRPTHPPPPSRLANTTLPSRTSVLLISYWMRSPHTQVYALTHRVRQC